MTVIKIKPQASNFIDESLVSLNSTSENNSHIQFLSRCPLYQKTSKFHSSQFQSTFKVDALVKNFSSYFNSKKHNLFLTLSYFSFFTFIICNLFLAPSFFSITIFESYNPFFTIISFLSMIMLFLFFPSLLSEETIKIDSTQVPLIWILYHNLQFKSEAQKESWLLHNISQNNYHYLFFFSPKSFEKDIRKYIVEAQSTLDNS